MRHATIWIMLALVSPAARADPAGLGLYFANGTFSPLLDPTTPQTLHVVDGPSRYLQEIDLVSRLPTTPADGLAPIISSGDFAALDWTGVAPVAGPDGEDWRLMADGFHWMHSVYYRDARWMSGATALLVVPVDGNGAPVGLPLVGVAGLDGLWLLHVDDFFERRFVARVVTQNCQALGDCSNAGVTSYAEALMHLRGAMNPSTRAAPLPPAAQALKLYWSSDLSHARTVALAHDAAPSGFGYGFGGSLQLTNPPARGYFLPGETATFQVTWTDGAGNRLFPAGTLPSYGEMAAGLPSAAGIQYLNFADDPILYWAHKNTQSDMTISLIGPIDRVNQVAFHPITPFNLFDSQIVAGTVAENGYDAMVQILPPTTLVFGCFLGNVQACVTPASDQFSFIIPADAQPGTYSAQVKGRRLFAGEPLQAGLQAPLQVLTPTPTQFAAQTGGCDTCHSGRAAVPVVGHGFPGNGTGPWCYACHTGTVYTANGYNGYYFEPDAGLDQRVHRMHSLSRRYASVGGDIQNCSSCHLTPPAGPLVY
jgi:hypothetical protein